MQCSATQQSGVKVGESTFIIYFEVVAIQVLTMLHSQGNEGRRGMELSCGPVFED